MCVCWWILKPTQKFMEILSENCSVSSVLLFKKGHTIKGHRLHLKFFIDWSNSVCPPGGSMSDLIINTKFVGFHQWGNTVHPTEFLFVNCLHIDINRFRIRLKWGSAANVPPTEAPWGSKRQQDGRREGEKQVWNSGCARRARRYIQTLPPPGCGSDPKKLEGKKLDPKRRKRLLKKQWICLRTSEPEKRGHPQKHRVYQ